METIYAFYLMFKFMYMYKYTSLNIILNRNDCLIPSLTYGKSYCGRG